MRARTAGTRGLTLLEVSIALVLTAVVVMSAISLAGGERARARAALDASVLEHRSQLLLGLVQRELVDAAGAAPKTTLAVALAPDGTTAEVVSTQGFPPRGYLVLDRGTPLEERLRYEGIDATRFLGLERGVLCTSAAQHLPPVSVLWSGVGETLPDQTVVPPPESYDGVALEEGVPTYFRGDGSGFAFRVAVDADGDGDPIEGGAPEWGAEVPGVGATADGWSALWYDPETELTEEHARRDLNGDGDEDDVFDVGRIRRATWSAADPAGTLLDVGVGPTCVLQERCAWGGDLDGDGYDDPLFLWNPTTRELHVRLTVVAGFRAGEAVVRRVDTVLFLRNAPQG